MTFMCDAQIQLIVPADQSMMLVIRLATAGALARAQLTVDAIDDLKMAVEEACTLMISQECPPTKLYLEFFRRESAMDIHVHGEPGAVCVCGMDEGELDVVCAILNALSDAAEIDFADGRIRNILLTKDLSR